MTMVLYIWESQQAAQSASSGLSFQTFIAGGVIALLASIVTVLGSFWLERNRAKEARKRKLQEDKLEACIAFLASARDAGIAAAMEEEFGLEQKMKAADAQARIVLLMGKATRDASNEVVEVMKDRKNRKQPHETLDQFNKRTNDAILERIEKFREQVRKELDIESLEDKKT